MIDNLGKGAAGQAIQNMNLALGYPETAGLLSLKNVNPRKLLIKLGGTLLDAPDPVFVWPAKSPLRRPIRITASSWSMAAASK